MRLTCFGPVASNALEMPKSSTLTSGDPSARVVEEEVGRLKIAVHNPRSVRVGDRLHGLEQVLDGLFEGELPSLGEHLVQIEPVQVLHHEVGRPSSRRPASITRTTCSLCKTVTARASRRNRLTASSSFAASRRRT